jgi:hypothetical protein
MSFTSGGWRVTGIDLTAKPLGAILFEEGEDVNAIMADFAQDLARSGCKVAGFVQVLEEGPGGRLEPRVQDLETGARLPVYQDLGRSSQGCRIDPGALIEVGRRLTEALQRRPDILMINRFGKLESEGDGLIDEIAAAALSGIPVLIGVAWRYHDAWRQFAMGLDDELTCSRAALDAWWQRQMVAAGS